MYSSNVLRVVGVAICWIGAIGAVLIQPVPGILVALIGTVIYVGGEVVHHIDDLKDRR